MGLLLEAAQTIFVCGEVARQELEGDPAAQPLVMRQVDFSHPACPKRSDYLVVPDRLPDH